MSNIHDHLQHIEEQVVPARRALQGEVGATYAEEVAARAQPPHLARGLEQWNAGRFFEQHETLEWLWRATNEPVRDAFKGIILSGVGALHVTRHNRHGALAKWTSALAYLAPFVGILPYGIEISLLVEQVEAARVALLSEEAPHWEAHVARVRGMHIQWLPRLAAPRVTTLLRRMDRAWQDSPFSVEVALEGMRAAEAEWSLAPGGHSIAALVAVLGQGKAQTGECCFGEGGEAVGEVPARWRKRLAWLSERHEALREPLGFLGDGALEGRAGGSAEGRTLEEAIAVSIERDLFFAGRIRQIREWLAAKGEGAG